MQTFNTIADLRRYLGDCRAAGRTVGLVPTISDSADKHANGHITKSGNPHVRTALIEGVSNMHVRKASHKALREGQDVPGHVLRLCWQCDERMEERYKRMSSGSKPANVIKVALANEMARWVWAIGLAATRGSGM